MSNGVEGGRCLPLVMASGVKAFLECRTSEPPIKNDVRQSLIGEAMQKYDIILMSLEELNHFLLHFSGNAGILCALLFILQGIFKSSV